VECSLDGVPFPRDYRAAVLDIGAMKGEVMLLDEGEKGFAITPL